MSENKNVAERVLVRVIDDDPAIRETLSYLLQTAGFECVAYAGAMEFLTQDSPSVPGCAILDVRMPGMSGPALQAEMNRREIVLPVLFYSGHGCLELAVDTMRRGATTFLPKTVPSEDLLSAVAEAVEISLSRQGRRLTDTEIASRWELLAQRERDIAVLMGQGRLTSDISRQLRVSPKTVYNYRVEIHRKLKTKTQADVARMIYRLKEMGVIEPC